MNGYEYMITTHDKRNVSIKKAKLQTLKMMAMMNTQSAVEYVFPSDEYIIIKFKGFGYARVDPSNRMTAEKKLATTRPYKFYLRDRASEMYSNHNDPNQSTIGRLQLSRCR